MTHEERAQQVIHDWMNRRSGPDDLEDLRKRIAAAVEEATGLQRFNDIASARVALSEVQEKAAAGLEQIRLTALELVNLLPAVATSIARKIDASPV